MARRRVTIDTIARESQTSPTTVSLVLRDRPGISAETRERVLATARTLGYQHRAPMRAAERTDPLSIGLIARTHLLHGEEGTPSVNPFYSWVLAGIESAARGGDMNLLYASMTVDDVNRHTDLPTHLLRQSLDGVILVGAFRPESVAALRDVRSGPIILVDAAGSVGQLDVVMTDNLGGGETATQYLIDAGHRRIACLSRAEGINPCFDQRVAGYRAVMDANGLPSVIAPFTATDVETAIADLLDQHPETTAVFAANDRCARQAIAALRRRGREVPRDMSVIGFDNIDPNDLLLSTMAVDKTSLGRLAVDTLRYRLTWPDAAQMNVLLRPRLLARASVASPAAMGHPEHHAEASPATSAVAPPAAAL